MNCFSRFPAYFKKRTICSGTQQQAEALSSSIRSLHYSLRPSIQLRLLRPEWGLSVRSVNQQERQYSSSCRFLRVLISLPP